MVKPKQRRVPGKKQQDQVCPKTGTQDEQDWIFVKKQKITILIPPLPSKVQSPVHSLGEGQLQETPHKTESQSPRKTNSGEQLPSRSAASTQPGQESCSPLLATASTQSGHESAKSMLPSPEPARTSNPSLTLCNKVASENSSLPSIREHRGLGSCSSLKGNGEIMLFADNTKFPNRTMRASYLDKKLRKAGGLENWLVSLGLSRFVKVFQRRNVGKFQIANLTMEKLKVMGATNAVGPRRKLLHAIDCLCEPHCFQHM